MEDKEATVRDIKRGTMSKLHWKRKHWEEVIRRWRERSSIGQNTLFLNLVYMWQSQQNCGFWVKVTNWSLPVPRWPCEPHPAAESASFPACPWLSLPPPAAASPFADAASLPERHRQAECGQRAEDMVGENEWKLDMGGKKQQTKDGIWMKIQ